MYSISNTIMGKTKNHHLNDICWQFSLFFLRLVYHQGRDTVWIYLANNQGLVPHPSSPSPSSLVIISSILCLKDFTYSSLITYTLFWHHLFPSRGSFYFILRLNCSNLGPPPQHPYGCTNKTSYGQNILYDKSSYGQNIPRNETSYTGQKVPRT